MTPTDISVPSDLADRLTLLLDGLRRTIAARMAANRALGPLVVLIWCRLHRAANRFARLTQRIALGHPFTRRAPPNRPPRPSGPRDRLPGGVAWLLRLVPEAAVFGAQLQALLADPAMAPLLAAAPQAGRILRPLCRMLAVSPGPDLRRAAPQPHRTPQPAPDVAPAAGPWHRRNPPAGTRDSGAGTGDRRADTAPAPPWSGVFASARPPGPSSIQPNGCSSMAPTVCGQTTAAFKEYLKTPAAIDRYEDSRSIAGLGSGLAGRRDAGGG